MLRVATKQNVCTLQVTLSYRAIDKDKHTPRFGMNIGMDGSDTSHARRPRTQTLGCQDELAFQNVDEFRAFMRMQGNSRTG